MPQISDFVDGPLKDLFKPKYNYSDLRYPADLESAGKAHIVNFAYYDVKSTSVDQAVTAVVNGVKEGISKGLDAAKSGLSFAASQVGNSVVDPEKAKADRQAALDSVSVAGTMDYLDTIVGKFKAPEKEYKGHIMMYMPEAMSFSYNVGYDGATSITSAAQSVRVAGDVAKAATGIFDNQAAKMALRQFGYAFNPQAQMMFDNIDFRTYTMSFSFSPRSEKEAAQVQRIIKEFRKHAAPTVVKGSAGFFYTPPSIWQITFFHGTSRNDNLNQLKESVIESVDVDYAPNGWSAHEDGAPVQIKMSLNFKEISLVDRTEIEGGY